MRCRKTLLAVLAVVGAALMSMTWYRLHYSMGVTAACEVAGSPAGSKALVAAQGSAFKDAATAGRVEHLRRLNDTASPGL